MRFLFFIIFVCLLYPESELLRSKYLSQDMIDNIEKLDKYNNKARFILNKYEKAKFYQIVAFTYYLKYKDLIEELNSLERQYFSIISRYDADFDFSVFNNISIPKIKNTFSPILFSEQSEIKIRLFKAKAGLFEKQYHEYLDYFNEKVRLLSTMLKEAKENKFNNDNSVKINKVYDNYSNFISDIESDDSLDSNINMVMENDLIKEINWIDKGVNFKKQFFYLEESELDRIIDYKNEVKIMETMYDIDDDFIHYIIDNKFIRNISGHGNYAINFFNKFDNIYKTVYYSANGEIIGSIQFDFKENLELLSESWYIGDNRKKIKEFREIYDPKTHRYITIEERVIKELR